jgi:hypothetical protein
MPFLPRRWSVAALPLLLAGLSGNAGAPASATPGQDPGTSGETYAELKENDFVETSHQPIFPFAADDDTSQSLSCAGM